MLDTIISPKSKTSFDIQYIIVGKRQSPISIIPPQEFDNDFLRVLSYLPQSIVQLDHPIEHILLQWQTAWNSGYDLSIVYDDYAIDELRYFSSRQITVLFIDKGVKDKDRIIEAFRENGFFLFVYGRGINEGDYFGSPIQFINKVILLKKQIEEHFAKYGLNVKFNFTDEIPDELKKENTYDYFLPSMSNFFMLNQYIGNLYYDEDYKNSIDEILNGPSSKDDVKKEHFGRKNRIEIIMKQILTIDKFRMVVSDELPYIKKFGDINPQHTPMIIVSPYQYPQVEQLLPGIDKHPEFKYYKEAFKNEQDIEYNNQINVGNEDAVDAYRIASAAADFNRKRMNFLDSAAYLHASYTFSPILRLPLQGRGLNKYLSFFNPAMPIPNLNKLATVIKKFGREYTKNVLSESNANKLFGRNRQIVAITDLPIEWMEIDNTPLCVTHDVTRIPELPYGGIMSFYVKNKVVKYEVPTNILEKTLVVFGVKGDKYFDIGYKFIKGNSTHFGYKTIQCDSIAELKKEIEAFQPHLIIFDTHGTIDSVEKTSHIQIGKEFLKGEDIVKHGIVAPLIVLSACNTVPNWGYFNNIANAFFEAGALSVTGTFLPIGIFTGTTFYNRILVNLKLAQEKPIHSNWLNFVSHNIRTHYISENMLAAHKIVNEAKIPDTLKKQIGSKIQSVSSSLINQAMSFSKRKYIYKNINGIMKDIHPIFKNRQFSIPLEQLLYTNLGRGDLIMFSSWIKANAIITKQEPK